VALHHPRLGGEQAHASRPVRRPAGAVAPAARARVRVVPHRPRTVWPPA
jgi:hypothetical protein